MSYVRSRKFCCCLPVRFGVVLIAILGLLGGGFITVAGILQYRQTSGSKVALVIQIIIYGLLAVLSVLGLIGAIAKLRKLVSLYFTMLTAHLAFSICSGAFSLWRMFNDKHDCISTSDNDIKDKFCEKGLSVMRGVMVAAFIVVWLIQIWGCVIVNDYNKQLMEEEDVKHRRKDVERPQW
ncbi:hypothetical protein HGRIS_002302 [Hohenbuehelia grisea]|uniref:Uncharacterized protein n=1 Tax=Hohenbuehelia grisea TaxID=104357 RepID=A0ABR3JKT0_9AGAR